MPVSLLTAEETAALRKAMFTYPDVGATATEPPAGFPTLTMTRVLDRRDFDGATDDLMTWQVHARAGLRVSASAERAAPDEVVSLRLGVGPLAVRIPCRVVYVVDEPKRSGFAYGSLPGHPESGEEVFLVQQLDDGQIRFTVAAFSRPARLYSKLGGPVTRLAQAWMVRRYLKALDRPR